MIGKIVRKWNNIVLSRLHPVVWYIMAFGAYGVSTLASTVLTRSYEASQFPVPYFVGQTTFDAKVTKGHYATLIEQGTLDIFVQTQIIDYAYMASMFVTLLVFGAAGARLLRWRFRARWLTGAALAVMYLTAAGPVFDALENGVSFIMLSDPTGFPDWLVYPYSSFAVIKFALMVLGHIWAVVVPVLVLLATLVILPFRRARVA